MGAPNHAQTSAVGQDRVPMSLPTLDGAAVERLRKALAGAEEATTTVEPAPSTPTPAAGGERTATGRLVSRGRIASSVPPHL